MDKVQTLTIDEFGDNREAENQADDVESRLKEAAEFKEKGNTLVKSKEFESAIKMYTRAIEIYNKDHVFFSNRSQCYLKLEKYQECIDDATKAIELNPENSKAYYRRMVAYEKLGEDFKALKNCRKWLDLCPKDQEAEKHFDKIHNRIAEIEKKKDKEKIRWSKFGSKATSTNFVHRPAHLRSKKSLKKIPIGLHKAASPIPECIIDRIFDNNTGETNPHPETDSKLFKPNFLNPQKLPKKVEPIVVKMEVDQEETSTETPIPEPSLPQFDELEKLKSPLIITPSSGPQFVSIWKELDEFQKFLYLKNIIDSTRSIGEILSAQLDSKMLSEIILVLDKFFTHYKLPTLQILIDLKSNSEIDMLVMFLENEDKKRKFKSSFKFN